MMKTWGIVGLGWLGNELSLEIKKRGDLFWGTHRDSFDFFHDPFPTTECDILFLNSPPLVGISPKEFVQKMAHTQARELIFISSTSVYGTNVGRISEKNIPVPSSKNGQWLLDVEHSLSSVFQDRLKIIRPGGLIGGKRHPVLHLTGRSGIVGGGSPINLIHRTDLINIIMVLSESTFEAPVVNAVAPFHPNKSDYYFSWADKLNLPRPIFENGFSEIREIESVVLPSIYPHWVCPQLDFI